MEQKISTPKTAAQLLKAFLASVGDGNPKITASFFDPDGYIEAPYVASLGMPSIMKGKETIEATMQGLLQNAPNFSFTKIKIVMETPTEVVAEYESEATLTNGRAYKQCRCATLLQKKVK